MKRLAKAKKIHFPFFWSAVESKNCIYQVNETIQRMTCHHCKGDSSLHPIPPRFYLSSTIPWTVSHSWSTHFNQIPRIHTALRTRVPIMRSNSTQSSNLTSTPFDILQLPNPRMEDTINNLAVLRLELPDPNLELSLQAPSTFTCFPQLPIELRLKI